MHAARVSKPPPWYREFVVVLACLLVMSGRPSWGNAAEEAEHVLTLSGVPGGLVVHLGIIDGRFTAALRRDERYVVHGLSRDAWAVQQARRFLHSQGLTGSVSVSRLRADSLPYIDQAANLVVVQDRAEISEAEIDRVLAPLGVVLHREGTNWRRRVVACFSMTAMRYDVSMPPMPRTCGPRRPFPAGIPCTSFTIRPWSCMTVPWYSQEARTWIRNEAAMTR